VSVRRALAALLLLLAAACVPASSVANAQAPAPGVEFLTALRQAYDGLGGDAVLPRADARVQRAAAALQEAAGLAAPGSRALAPVIDDLGRDPADLADARMRLRTLLDALALPPNSVPGDFRAARGALDGVYRQDAFAGLDAPPSGDSFFARLGGAVLDGLRWLADHTVGALGTVPSLLLALLVSGIAAFFVVRRLQDTGTRAQRRSAAAEPPSRWLDAGTEWRAALQAAARDEFRVAVRHAFRSALLSAAESGRLRVDPAWTTGELLARARGDADLVAALAPAAASFDRAWYSGAAVTAADWEVARERCEAVRRLAARRGVAA
jgi:hypothetical protein